MYLLLESKTLKISYGLNTKIKINFFQIIRTGSGLFVNDKYMLLQFFAVYKNCLQIVVFKLNFSNSLINFFFSIKL